MNGGVPHACASPTCSGLENCPDGEDLQLFEMFVTENWRNHYDRMYVAAGGRLQSGKL